MRTAGNLERPTAPERRIRLSLVSLALAFALGAGATAAVAQPSQPGVFGDVIDVRVVNIEVVVTDRQGNRIAGLGASDFELIVDGKPVPVEFFSEVFGGKAVERLPGTAATAVPQLASGEPVGTSYLVFIDEYFSLQHERDRVLGAISEQLVRLEAQDRMAVVAYDGHELEMLSTWSQSTRELGDVLRRAQMRPTRGREWQALLGAHDFAREQGIDVVFRSGAGDVLTELSQEEERAVNDVTHQVERAVLAAISSLRGFADPPGRKVMILLSGGWPLDPVQFVTQSSFRSSADQPYARGEDLYGQLVATANRLSYTLYTVDTPGLGTDGKSASVSTPEEAAVAREEHFLRDHELDATLTAIARDTGGRAFLDGNQTDVLGAVASDTRSYYWLGFTPSWKGDDTTHDVRVRTLRAGLEVRARTSFSDLSRAAEVTMMVESSLLFGNPPSTEPLLTRVGQPRPAGVGRVTVPLSVMIPVSALTFIRQAEGYVAHTELRVAVLDENGNTADVPVVALPLVLEQPPQAGELRRFDTEVKIRKRQHDMVVSLYDTTSGKILSSRVEVDPG